MTNKDTLISQLGRVRIPSTSISLSELVERGLSEDAQDMIARITDFIPDEFPVEVAYALGFGPPCPCGERGMRPGEKAVDDTCADCQGDENDQG